MTAAMGRITLTSWSSVFPMDETLVAKIDAYSEGLLLLNRFRRSADKFIVQGEARMNLTDESRLTDERTIAPQTTYQGKILRPAAE